MVKEYKNAGLSKRTATAVIIHLSKSKSSDKKNDSIKSKSGEKKTFE